MSRLVLFLALVAGGLTGSRALASKAAPDVSGEMTVTDDAGLFTAEGIAKAKAAFHGTTFHGKVKYGVHTFKAIPAAKKAEFDAAVGDAHSRGEFFRAWAIEVARENGDTVATLIYMDGKRFLTRTVSNEATARDKGRGFSDQKAKELNHKYDAALNAALHKPLDDAARTALDASLMDATNVLIEDLRNTTVPVANSHDSSDREKPGKGIMGYVCLGLCVLLGAWLVIGLIRAFTGGGGGGGYGGGGGGGGGFMSSMLGGMFGGLAGMWMYNHMFGGGMSGLGASEGMAGNGGGDFNDAGDGFDNGATGGSEGGDWGDAGGGDWGDGGGGDWGGGDFGGGGDW